MKPLRWYHLKDIPSDIPVLDFAQLQQNEQNTALLRNTLSTPGIFYLTNFGIEKELLQKMVDITASFFSQDDAEKEPMICKDLPLRGYTPLKSENLAKLLKVGDYPDLCMKYSWCPKNNVYPDKAFQQVWQNYYDKISQVAKQLLILVAKALEGETDCNDDDWQMIIQSDNTLRHLYYPDLPDLQELGMAPHSDLGSVTILYQTPAPNGHIALEAEIDGKFVPIPAVEGTLVVNFGDTLSHITKRKVLATKHRIVHTPKPGSQRTSTICFCLLQRDFNLKKFRGGDFCGLFTEDITTFGELIDKDGTEYLNKQQKT